MCVFLVRSDSIVLGWTGRFCEDGPLEPVRFEAYICGICIDVFSRTFILCVHVTSELNAGSSEALKACVREAGVRTAKFPWLTVRVVEQLQAMVVFSGKPMSVGLCLSVIRLARMG